MATARLLLRTASLRPLRRSPLHSSRHQPRAAMASDAASQFHKIQIQREDTTFDAYVVGKENAPGVVVLQEWWGVDYEVKNHAIHISQSGDGYRALIPDLYRGKVALEVAEAQHLMEGLDWPGAIKDIQALVKWLKENGSPKVGVTGYCMGGSGSNPGSFWELDSFVGFADVTAAKSLEEKLKASGVAHEVHIYPGCSHAFMNASPEALERRKGMGLTDENQEPLTWHGPASPLDGLFPGICMSNYHPYGSLNDVYGVCQSAQKNKMSGCNMSVSNLG
ncbi:hypothetical protein ZWY2020_041226 [Hordeum vulgare]|nr:hypothetical protein ZWY2020_041226 [Hordeum vulgare]